jgi:Flp pilus assembly protein TadG
LKGRRTARAGQTMVEFAIVATGFLLVTFAIMQYALAVFAYNAVGEAASEGARYAASHSPTSANPATVAQVQAVATNSAPALNAAGLTITVTYPADANLPTKKDAKVQIAYTYSLAVPFLTTVNLTLNGASQMLVSQ